MSAGAAAAHGAAGGRSGFKSRASPATGYSTARDSQPESFEEWQAMFTASAPAKTEHSVPLLSTIPPKWMRLFEGQMEKKALSSSGVKWHGRYATLTDFHLGFAKRLDMNSTEATHWMHTKHALDAHQAGCTPSIWMHTKLDAHQASSAWLQ